MMNLLKLLRPAASLQVEAAVVGAVCAVFLILFIVAGIRQIMKDRE